MNGNDQALLDMPGAVIDTLKMSPDDPVVNYRYAVDPERSCGMCVHFIPPGGCHLVMGMIRPVDVCNLFEPKPDGGRVPSELVSNEEEADEYPAEVPALEPVQAEVATPQYRGMLGGRKRFVQAYFSDAEAGTSAGVKKSWITRKGGGGGQKPGEEKPGEEKPEDKGTTGGGVTAPVTPSVGGSKEPFIAPGQGKYWKDVMVGSNKVAGLTMSMRGQYRVRYEKNVGLKDPSGVFSNPHDALARIKRDLAKKPVQAELAETFGPQQPKSKNLADQNFQKNEAGTSAGVKKAWITRKGGGRGQKPEEKKSSVASMLQNAGFKDTGKKTGTGHLIYNPPGKTSASVLLSPDGQKVLGLSPGSRGGWEDITASIHSRYGPKVGKT